MIEAISTLSVQSAALRANPPSASSFSPVQQASAPNMGFLSIRMDHSINKAILEYRSTEGEVIKQYPSESQIRAFVRSSELESKPEASAQQSTADTSASSFQFADVAATPTHVDVLPASSAAVGGSAVSTAPSPAPSSSGSTQSVLV